MISVVMCVYNEKINWVKLAIESILKQTYTNIELIVIIDNPNNLELKNLIEEFASSDKRIKSHTNKVNMGLARSLNIGMELSSGEYIARMDADDISFETRFDEQITFLENNPRIALVGTGVQYIDENDRILNKKNITITKNSTIKLALRVVNTFKHPTIVFRRVLYETIGGYNNFNSAQDYDFFTRIVLAGFKVSNIQKELLYYRIRENSISNTKLLDQKVNAAYIRNNYIRKKAFDWSEYEEYYQREMNNHEEFKRAENHYNCAIMHLRNKRPLMCICYLVKCFKCSGLWRHTIIEAIFICEVKLLNKFHIVL